jgi:hypothetical protein
LFGVEIFIAFLFWMKYKLGQTTVCPYSILDRQLYLTQLRMAIDEQSLACVRKIIPLLSPRQIILQNSWVQFLVWR